MIRLIAGYLFVAILCSCGLSAAAAESRDELEEGKIFIQKKQYQQAVVTLEAALQHGLHTPGLYYNLGNACFETRKIGKAILYYERGLIISPFNAMLLNNRDFVLKQASLKTRSSVAIFDRLDLRKMADRMLFVSLVILLICSGIYLLWSIGVLRSFSQRILKIFRYSFRFSILICLVLSIFLWIAQPADYAILMHRSVIRTGPAAQANVAFELKEGERVEILKSYGKWNKIKNRDGQSGWVANVAVEKL
ncbi:SH3 domain-containing protein [Pedobacter metabolipauper]|uniref:Tetratricopeptide repeat protein n=1 Tax=Pedobacter metabolipauper TaxID=425513 RepID=A0A4R6SXN6_9SPHI|nr:SH3 domain-containing protein [Pedobacter metabolipauper]TDQ09424.1 tetratricopeptide repeat protein [Pedobacter metabolipauper]